jgi:hypothetical protein
VWHRGDPVFPNRQPHGRKYKRSGLLVTASSADFDAIRQQVSALVGIVIDGFLGYWSALCFWLSPSALRTMVLWRWRAGVCLPVQILWGHDNLRRRASARRTLTARYT